MPQPIAKSTVQPLGRGSYVLTAPFSADIDGLGIAVHLPAGYVTDLASIPRWAWALVGHPATGEFQDAAIIHDWICDLAVDRQDYSIRLIGDAIFFHLLQVAGVSYWKRALMYLAVRTHGYWTFRSTPDHPASENREKP